MRKHLTAPGIRWLGQQTVKTACNRRASAHDCRPEGPISCPGCQHAATVDLQQARELAQVAPQYWEAIGQCGFY